jgi:D-aminoacyl-tRNA deacylase
MHVNCGSRVLLCPALVRFPAMKAVLQRVSSASVEVDGQVVGSIAAGFMVLLGVEQGDVDRDAQYLAGKTAELRVFADDAGKMNLSIKDLHGSVLLISQFTLLADWRKGRRPGFTRAAGPAEGQRLYEYFGKCLEQAGVPVEYGVFGADMKVTLTNDGPVTLLIENKFADGSDDG